MNRYPGIASAVMAYTIWGLLPLYFVHLASAGYADILQHRIIWSALFLGIVLLVKRRALVALKRLLDPKIIYTVLGSGLLIGSNWLFYAYAVLHGKTLEASLAYFINPLLTALMARVFFSESLELHHIVAFGFGAAGVIWQLLFLDQVPWIALILAGTFALYGVAKKKLSIPAVEALWLETLLLLPALGILSLMPFWNSSPVLAHFDNPTLMLLLAGLGITTTLPLMLFTQAAQRLPLVAMALLQYLSPSLKFIVAIAFLGEALTAKKLTSYGLVWIGVAVFIIGTLHSARTKRLARNGVNSVTSE